MSGAQTFRLRLLKDDVTFSVISGVNTGGDPIFAAQQTIKALVTSGEKLVIDREGNEKKSTHEIISLTEIPQKARVWVFDDVVTDDTQGRRVIASGRFPTCERKSVVFQTFLGA